MRALGVMSLLVAGASAGIVLSDHSSIDRIGRKLGFGSVQIAAEPAVREPAAQEPGARSWSQRIFSPSQPLVAQRSAGERPATVNAAPAPQGPIKIASQTEAGAGRPEVETATLHPRAAGGLVGPVPARREATSRTMDDAAKANLARDIQTELRRVGCYDGNIDSDWGPAAKRAMKAFTERMNAVLPVEQPDHILLTLVKGHRGKACGAGCALGEVAVEGGRCVPKPVLAQRPAMRLEPRQAAVGTPARGTEPAAAPAQSAAGRASWSSSTTTIAASPAPAPVTAPAPVQITMSPRTGGNVPQPALPGRMAVGGPTSGTAEQEPASAGAPAIAPLAPSAAGDVAAVGEAALLPPPPAPAAPKRKVTSGPDAGGGSSGYRQSSGYERTFKNPKVVREFFFGHGG